MRLRPIHFGLILLGIFGIWLIYWNITDFAVSGIDHGIWDWSLLENGWKSLLLGIAILFGVGYTGTKVMM